MNANEIFKEELARRGVLNSFPATPENIQSFTSALEAAQVRLQIGFNELQQKIVSLEQAGNTKQSTIADREIKISQLEGELLNKANQIDGLNSKISGLHTEITRMQTEAQQLQQSLVDKDAVIERQKSELAKK